MKRQGMDMACLSVQLFSAFASSVYARGLCVATVWCCFDGKIEGQCCVHVWL